MSGVPAAKPMSEEEYLSLEDASGEKLEFVDGRVHAMAGADFPHNQITSNAQGSIWQFLRDKNCRIYGSDLKVNVKTKSDFVYPDLSIVCGSAQFFKGKRGIVTNPSVIIEVLSPDTERYDRGKKFMLYRQIETVQEYILVSSMEPLVERFKKEAGEVWTLKDYRNLDDHLLIGTIGYELPLMEIYRDVVFDEMHDGEEHHE